MELQHIELENLKTTKVNVRKKGGKTISDLVPSIRSLGLLQPLLVRPNCEGYEIVAGQRRFHALSKLSEEKTIDPVPCIVMDKEDDATAIEASLAENIARLPMDEIDQYKAFSSLVKQGLGVEDIARQFGITERLVRQRLAIANLISPILKAYQKDQIHPQTLRLLTLATKRQQKEWWTLFSSDGERAPDGYQLKCWLFGGEEIPAQNALFDLDTYQGQIVSNLFGEDRYFADANQFWEAQNTAIAQAKDAYLAQGWNEVVILDIGDYFPAYDYIDTSKEDGGNVYAQIAQDGEVIFYEGQLSRKEVKAKRKAEQEGDTEGTPAKVKAEITQPMQNYLDLHRHSAVRAELLNHGGIALRMALAQIIAGSKLWNIHADPQKFSNDAIRDSLSTNKAEEVFSEARQTVRGYLGMADIVEETLVYRKDDYGKSHDIYGLFAKLLELDDETVNTILTFVVAETLPCGSALVEVLGNLLSVEMSECWTPDEIFFGLLRDKEGMNAILKEVGGKAKADANITATAKVQKQLIQNCLKSDEKKKDWLPRYTEFPMRAYTKRGGIQAIDNWKAVKKHYR